MARIYGINGILRGRQGNNVFSVQNGTQVVKAYQPVVSNPRTLNQQLQRSKFALAGKLSSVVPSGAIVGLMGLNKRSRRAEFVRVISKLATTTYAPAAGGYFITSRVALADIQFSQGAIPRCAFMSGTGARYDGQGLDWRLVVSCSGFNTSQIRDTAPAGYGELVIVCMFDPTGSRLDACQYAIRTLEDMTFEFQVASRTGCVAAIYVAPYAPIDGRSSFGAAGNLYNDTDSVALRMDLDSYLAGMNFGNSVLATSISVAAPTQAIAPAPDDDTRKKK